MAGRAPRIGLLPAPRGGGPRGRFAVVAGRFNEAVSKKLLDGAVEALAAHGVSGRDLEVHWVPGSFELAQAAISLDDGHLVADPFRPSGELAFTLAQRARTLKRAERGRMGRLPRVFPAGGDDGALLAS